MTAQKVELGTIALVINGFAFKSTEYVSSGIRIMRITNVQKGCIQDDNPRFIEISRSAEFASFLLSAGDILVSLTGNVGRVGVIQDSMLPAALNQRVAALKVNSNSKIDQRYLFHILNSDTFENDAIKNSKGIAQLNLSSKWVEKYEIPLPPLAEQKRIAKILDAADALRAKRRESLAQLDALLQSTFLEMFGDPVENPNGWPVAVLGDVASKVTDGDHHTPKREQNGIKLLSARNVLQGRVDLTNTDFVGQAEYERMIKRCNPERDDILISCSGSIGRVARIQFDEPIALVRSAALIKVNRSAVSPVFLEHLLRTPYLQAQMNRAAKSSSQANLFQKPIRDLNVVIPDDESQTEFGQFVGHHGSQVDRVERHLIELDMLFSSLQHRAFAGQL